MAAKKKSKAAKLRAKRAKAIAAVAKDTFAQARVETLGRRLGEFKTAPESIGGDLSAVGAQLEKQFDAFLAVVGAMSKDIDGQFAVLVGETFEQVQRRTPVDTGNARSGWTIERLEGNGETVWRIANSVGYAVYLEYGWSKQAPAGMLRVSLLELEQRLVRAVEAYANAA